jgi:hypothetical protein
MGERFFLNIARDSSCRNQHEPGPSEILMQRFAEVSAKVAERNDSAFLCEILCALRVSMIFSNHKTAGFFSATRLILRGVLAS